MSIIFPSKIERATSPSYKIEYISGLLTARFGRVDDAPSNCVEMELGKVAEDHVDDVGGLQRPGDRGTHAAVLGEGLGEVNLTRQLHGNL